MATTSASIRCIDWSCTVGWPACGGVPPQLSRRGSAVQTRRTALVLMMIRLRLKSCARTGGHELPRYCADDRLCSAGRDEFNDLPLAVRELAPVQDVLPQGILYDFKPDCILEPAA